MEQHQEYSKSTQRMFQMVYGKGPRPPQLFLPFQIYSLEVLSPAVFVFSSFDRVWVTPRLAWFQDYRWEPPCRCHTACHCQLAKMTDRHKVKCEPGLETTASNKAFSFPALHPCKEMYCLASKQDQYLISTNYQHSIRRYLMSVCQVPKFDHQPSALPLVILGYVGPLPSKHGLLHSLTRIQSQKEKTGCYFPLSPASAPLTDLGFRNKMLPQ